MRVLFVHQNFPGQFRHVAAALAARPEHEVAALCINDRPAPKGVRVFRYRPKHSSSSKIHPFAADFETKLIRGEASAYAAQRLKEQGFSPYIICGHHGWGELLFLRDIWPKARMLTYIEFFFRHDTDFNFDPEFASDSLSSRFGLRVKNANTLLTLDVSDWAVTPTRWQWQQIPREYQSKVSVTHDGIDTDAVRPNRHASIKLGRLETRLLPGDEVITFVNRNLEPYRGYHVFMRAIPEILKRRPKARVVIVGGDQVSYGRKAPAGQTWKSIFLNEIATRVDLERVHFVGNLPYATYLHLLQISAVHVYLTYPFVLSWSMLEAMACECLVIGSATPPVQEVIRDGINGVLVDFFSIEQITAAVVKALETPKAHYEIRKEARRTIKSKYDLTRVCLPEQLRLIEEVARSAASLSHMKSGQPARSSG